MDRRSFLSATGAVGSAAALGGVARASDGASGGPNLLIGLSATASATDFEDRLPDEATMRSWNPRLGYAEVEVEDAGVYGRASVAARIQRRPEVRYVERERELQAFEIPDDPRYDDQYAPQQVRAERAWETSEAESGVTIAVVDQGVMYDHPDLADRFGSVEGKDFVVDDDDDPYPENMESEYHGTHVAGIAAATTDNDEGIAGVSNADLLSCRALNATGRGTTGDIADAVQWAADQGADVINLSLGGGGFSETMKNAVSYAVNQGSLPVCAAGNSGNEGVSYPAAYNECVAVAALDDEENLAGFSQYGQKLDVAAPGVDVLSCWTKSDAEYSRISGTSMACPAAAGVAALGKATHPDHGPNQLRDLLKSTAVDVGLPMKKQGAGRVDAANIVAEEDDRDNSQPVASYTVSGTPVFVDEAVTLDASRSGDPDGTIERYEWDLGDGTTATGETVTHTWTARGEYEVTLTVTDDEGATDEGTRSLEVLASERPTSSMWASATPVEVGETVAFDGRYSSDPDGSIASYDWDFDDGTTATGETATHTYDAPGEYAVELAVTDDSGEPATETERLVVEPEGEVPGEDRERLTRRGALERITETDVYEYSTATDEPARVDLSLITELGADFDLYCTLDGRRPTTTDYDRRSATTGNEDAIRLEGAVLDGETELGVLVAVYSGSGEYRLAIEERGDGGGDRPDNEPPEAAINANRTTVSPGDPVSMNALDAEDPDGEVVAYEWDFGNGTVDTGQFVTAFYEEPGTYRARLTVTDDDGATDTATKPIVVESDNEGPTAAIDADPDPAGVGQAITFDAGGSSDPDGSIASYDWGFDDGTTATGETVTRAFDRPGTYWVTLSVTDDEGATDRESTSVEVREAEGCGVLRKTTRMDGALERSYDEDAYEYEARTEDPCQIVVSLDGPENADFDLYLTTDGRRPTDDDYDELSATYDSQEQIVVDDWLESDTELGVLVRSWSGAGEYALSVDETGR
jgi:serine protease